MKNKWFAYCSDNEGAELNLLAFSYAGAGASVFINWKKYIDKKTNVYPVLYPFREARRSEALPDSLVELARTMAAENEELFSGRYAIFGHCAGAVIAYEVICEAKRLYGTEPDFIIASGAEPPGFSLEDMRGLEGKGEEEFLEYLIEKNFADETVRSNEGFLKYYLPIIVADFKMMFSYVPTENEKLSCPIYLFRGREDRVINTDNVKQWDKFTSGEIREVLFDGGHYYFTASPENICAEINKILD